MIHLTIRDPAYHGVPLCLCASPEELLMQGDTTTTEPDLCDCAECREIWEEYRNEH